MGLRVLVSKISLTSSAMSLSSHSAWLGPVLAEDHTSGFPLGSRFRTGVAMSEAGSSPRVIVGGRLGGAGRVGMDIRLTGIGTGPPSVIMCLVPPAPWGPPVELAACAALVKRGLRRVGGVAGEVGAGVAARWIAAVLLAARRARELALAAARAIAWPWSASLRAGVGVKG